MKAFAVGFGIALSVILRSGYAHAAAECDTPRQVCITECMNAGSSQDNIACYNQQQAKAERALNTTYQRLMPLANKFDPRLGKTLREAERAWVAFRQANCAFYDGKDRARYGFERADCMLRMTRERESELKEAADELAGLVE